VSKLRGGIDLGGTKVQAIVVDERHEVAGQARHPTPVDGGPDSIIEALAAAQRDAAQEAGIDTSELVGLGLGSPGDVDDAAGTIGNAGNLTGFADPVPVAARLRDELGVEEVRLGNDVSVATAAEFELGAAREHQSLLGVFWGTGVGGGVILDGREWHGRGAAGEIGHMVVKKGGAKCPCGRVGCMEAYAGRKAMELEARRRHDKGEKTVLFKLMKERDRDRLTAGIWSRAAQHGDELALEILDRAYGALGAGVASAVNLLDVEAVVLGGGVGIKFGEQARDRLVEEMRPHLFNDDRPPAVLLAGLGDLGGAIGASLLVGRPAAVVE
jgi:glucokinase